MQKSKSSIESIFSRNIEIYSLIGWFIVERNHETLDYIRILLDIIKYYGSISAKQIASKFGLEDRISNNLLLSLNRTYPNLLSVEEKNTQNYFSINQDYKEDDFKSIVEEIEMKLQFGICIEPLFFVDRFIRPDKDIEYKSIIDTEQIVDTLNQIISNTNNNLDEDSITLPDHLRFQSNKGAYLQGKTIGQLVFNEQHEFDVYIKDKFFNITITKTHPDYSKFIEELEEIKNQADSIDAQITNELEKILGKINYNYNINLDSGILIINITEDRNEYIGIVMNLLKLYEQKIFEIQLNNYWTLNLNIEVNVENKSIQSTILFFNIFLEDIDKNFESMLKLKRNKILNYVNKVWKKSNKNSNYVWSKKALLNHVKLIQDQNYSILMNYIYGKFMEEIIFV